MQQLVACLREIGLTAYQARAYLTLLRYGPLTASRIARYGDIPNNKCYEAARALESIGFVARSVRPPYVYRAEEPAQCLERLLEARTRRREELKREFLGRVGTLAASAPPEGGVWYHTLREVGRGKVQDVMRSARRELILLNANGTAQKFRRTLEELAGRVSVRVRPVEGDADILIVDRERAFFLPHEHGGVEIAFPAVADTLARLA